MTTEEQTRRKMRDRLTAEFVKQLRREDQWMRGHPIGSRDYAMHNVQRMVWMRALQSLNDAIGYREPTVWYGWHEPEIGHRPIASHGGKGTACGLPFPSHLSFYPLSVFRPDELCPRCWPEEKQP